MTTYTLTQTQWDNIFDASSVQIRTVLRSLKPNSQEPAGILRSDEFDGHVFEPTSVWPFGPLYTHPAPISKEDMVKVLEALQQAGIPAHLDVSAKGKANYSVLREAITIMQSAIEGMK